MTQALLTDLYRPRPEPARTGFPEGGGGPRRAGSARRGWILATVLIVLLVIAAVGARVAHPARGNPEEQAWIAASAAHATTWVALLAEGNGRLAQALSCAAASKEYPDASGAELQNDFDRFLGGELVQSRVDDVEVVDGAYFVTIKGVLDDGDPVAFVVLVAGEDGHWRACGFGTLDQIP
ncbi:hypothetical protein E4P39_02075 [Blastococcus sp. CT_GayMR19]|uniref:Rv0361 family membrane protein n=1 Tax=Blastococcus sp. CT_GayMR19 TaxID=2559608 RepID=UPI001073E8E6|nr:hypothetical protein [Blastococcus sp. CT_GayMR19]TFV79442.1 hypothetical protein E4P39_02075 [Blastococcus sp. CT_GayMR19]